MALSALEGSSGCGWRSAAATPAPLRFRRCAQLYSDSVPLGDSLSADVSLQRRVQERGKASVALGDASTGALSFQALRAPHRERHLQEAVVTEVRHLQPL